jgi:exosortase
MATTPLIPTRSSATPAVQVPPVSSRPSVPEDARTPSESGPADAGAHRGLVALLRDAVTPRDGRPSPQRPLLFGALGCFVLLGMTFAVNLKHFVYAWSTDENYSHGFLVPLISLYFADQAARRGPVHLRAGSILGIILLTFSLLTRLAMILVPIPFLGDLALLIGLAGICALLFGVEALKRYGFAIFFLVFMVPLPIALYTRIASPLQLLASQIATIVLNAAGVPVLCEGNMMTLPGGVQMFVAEACSGMRQLTGFLALTTAVAYLSVRPVWYRAAVILSAVPIAITANVARVILTGCIMYFVDAHYASGTYHTVEGLLMMGFGLSLLRAECWVLDQVSSLVVPPGSDGAASSSVGHPGMVDA